MNNYTEALDTLVGEVHRVAKSVDSQIVEKFIELILSKKTIFIYGSGRSGLVGQYFAVRLVQMKLDVHFVGDMTTPIIGKDDLTIVISNTGETMSAVQTANIARRIGSHVVSITGAKTSKLANASNTVIVVNPKTEVKKELIPLGTLFEDSVIVMLDSIIPLIMDKLNQTEESMRKNHAIWV